MQKQKERTLSEFEELMGQPLSFTREWDAASYLYYRFNNEDRNVQLIPKKIHQIWFGDMPDEHKSLIPGIIENHPDWEYKLWSLEDAEKYPMVNKDVFDKAENLGQKSDIFRYEILYNEGGIYLDSDFEMVGSFDSLLGNELFTGIGHVSEPEVFNGLIGCTKHNDLMKRMIDNLSKKIENQDIMSSTGPYFFTANFFKYILDNEEDPDILQDKKIVVLPTPYFYPFPAVHRHYIRGRLKEMKDYIHAFNTNHTICVHLWFNSWQ